jgi:hypothetical protein
MLQRAFELRKSRRFVKNCGREGIAIYNIRLSKENRPVKNRCKEIETVGKGN